MTPKALTQEERYRQLLGLPFGRHLAVTEIQQAFKRAAKTMHPDGGGNGAAFLELAAARDLKNARERLERGSGGLPPDAAAKGPIP
mgnify:CR=1 FL=1